MDNKKEQLKSDIRNILRGIGLVEDRSYVSNGNIFSFMDDSENNEMSVLYSVTIEKDKFDEATNQILSISNEYGFKAEKNCKRDGIIWKGKIKFKLK